MKNLLYPNLKRGSNQYVSRKKRSYWKAYLAFYILVVTIVLFTASYYRNLGRQEGTVTHINLVVKAQEPVVIPNIVATGEKYSKEEIARRISILESGAGTNTNPDALHNVCKAQNKENLWGYGGMAMMICFDSFDQGQARVMRWFEEHMQTMTLEESLCMYNQGIKTDDCDYVTNFKSL